ncbi:LysM peptidoglycan-binding domain-containing protein [Corynebacterium nuruki]|uniref:LysM peptidoglycan-binding domain-containing protein n=1 Tax=Corynebacterium nuruki TaxID=1032851 RepID=UPI002357D0EC
MAAPVVYPVRSTDHVDHPGSLPTRIHGTGRVRRYRDAGTGAGRSNTAGHGEAVRPTSAARARLRMRTAPQERPFEVTGRTAALRRRIRSVAQSPGGVLLSFAAALLLVGGVPVLTGSLDHDTGQTPEPAVAAASAGDRTSSGGPGTPHYVRVAEGQSLYDIARSQAPDIAVGEAMAALSDLNELGDRDPRPGTLLSVPEW